MRGGVYICFLLIAVQGCAQDAKPPKESARERGEGDSKRNSQRPSGAIPKTLMNFEHVPGKIQCIALSSDSKTLAIGCEDGTVKLWDVETGEVLARSNSEKKKVNSLAFSPDGKLIASGSSAKVVRIWEVPGGKEKAVLEDPKEPTSNTDIMSVAFRPDGKSIFGANYNGEVKEWEVETHKERTKFWTVKQLESIVLAPDGTFLVAGGGSQITDKPAPRVGLFKLPEGKPADTILKHLSNVEALAITKDGKLLAAGGGRLDDEPLPKVNLWEVATGKLKGSLQGHKDLITALAFSPDGKLLASVGWETRIWDVDKGREIAKINNSDLVRGVIFGSDGKTLFSGLGNRVQVWDLRPVLQSSEK